MAVRRATTKSIRHSCYGQKGFTLIELLVVIAILGVLAGVVVPRVGKFIGEGKDEAGVTELHNVQTAVTAVMADQEPPLSTVTAVAQDDATQDMTAFPDATHPLHGSLLDPVGPNYIQKSTTEYWYSVDADGTVHGWWTDDPADGEIGVDPPP